MKKLYTIALAAFIFGSCNNDEAAVAELHVVKAQLDFNATAQKGYIIMSEHGCVATTSADWCRTEVKEDSVLVFVENNTALEGRTAVVTIQANGNTQTVPVTQYGGYFRLDSESTQVLGDSNGEIYLDIATPFDYEVRSSQNWMTVERTSKGVKVEVDENKTGEPRMAASTFTCPIFEKSTTFTLHQYAVDDLMGEWTAEYTNMSGKQVTCPVILTRQNKDVMVSGLPDEVTLKGKVTAENDFAFTVGTALGIYMGEYRIYLSGVDSDGGIRDAHDPDEKVKETRTVNYGKQLLFDDEDSYSCEFAADSVFSNGKSMTGIAVTVYDNKGNALGLVEKYVNFKLRR